MEFKPQRTSSGYAPEGRAPAPGSGVSGSGFRMWARSWVSGFGFGLGLGFLVWVRRGVSACGFGLVEGTGFELRGWGGGRGLSPVHQRILGHNQGSAFGFQVSGFGLRVAVRWGFESVGEGSFGFRGEVTHQYIKESLVTTT